MKKNKLIPLIFLFAGLVGCALNDQYLILDPQPDVTESELGNGKIIELSIKDTRSDTKLGKITDVHSGVYSIELRKDFTSTLATVVGSSLEKKGFKIGPSDTKMIVQVDLLALSSKKMPLTFETNLEAKMSVDIKVGAKTYTNRLRIVTKKETAGPPYAGDSSELINEAVSKLLTDMLSREQLITILAR